MGEEIYREREDLGIPVVSIKLAPAMSTAIK